MVRLKDLQKDPFAKTIIKRSSSEERFQHVLRMLKRLEFEKGRLDAVGSRLAREVVDKGIGFAADDPRFNTIPYYLTSRPDRPGLVRVGLLEYWRTIYVVSDTIPPKMVAFCLARDARHQKVVEQLRQLRRSLKGMRGARTRIARRKSGKFR